MSRYGEMFDASGVQMVWNSHSLMDASKCLYYYKLSVIDSWRTSEANDNFIFGGVLAGCLEHFYLQRSAGMDREDAIRSSVLKAMVETIGWESKHHIKDRGTLMRTLVWYFDHWRNDFPVLVTDEGPAVEKLFRISVDNGIEFVGLIDRVIEYVPGNYYLMDQKSTGSTLSSYFFNRYNPNDQIFFYSWAGRAIFPVPIAGFIIDAAQVAVGFSRFDRHVIEYTDAQLDEWYNSAMHHIEAAQEAVRDNHFPQRFTSCMNYGGCEFREICKRSPEFRGNFLKKDFVQVKE
jgi:hypothetical protein